MKIPRRIIVCGMEWSIRLSDTLSLQDPPLWGDCDHERKTIEISSDHPQTNVVFHETVHAISESMGYDPTEKQVDEITCSVLSFFQANKPFIRWLLKSLAD